MVVASKILYYGEKSVLSVEKYNYILYIGDFLFRANLKQHFFFRKKYARAKTLYIKVRSGISVETVV